MQSESMDGANFVQSRANLTINKRPDVDRQLLRVVWDGRKKGNVELPIDVHIPSLESPSAGVILHSSILTCKSFVMLGERGERQTEPSHSWFPPHHTTDTTQTFPPNRCRVVAFLCETLAVDDGR